MPIDLSGKVALVTGAGGGLGRCYALALARYGASVVVNDLGGSLDGSGASRVADMVVKEIMDMGGIAVANYDSVVDGVKLVQTALDNFGRIDIVVNNAGILRDKSFHKVTKDEWDLVNLIHVHGTRNVLQAAWPIMRKQRYGRVINITSTSGLYGNFGQANYSSAKSAVVGLARTLAIEGKKYNIKVNCVAPTAATRMTATTPSAKLMEKFFPVEPVARVIVVLASEQCPSSGSVFEAAGNYFAEVRLKRAFGSGISRESTADDLLAAWGDVTNFEKGDDPAALKDKTGNPFPQRAFVVSKL